MAILRRKASRGPPCSRVHLWRSFAVPRGCLHAPAYIWGDPSPCCPTGASMRLRTSGVPSPQLLTAASLHPRCDTAVRHRVGRRGILAPATTRRSFAFLARRALPCARMRLQSVATDLAGASMHPRTASAILRRYFCGCFLALMQRPSVPSPSSGPGCASLRCPGRPRRRGPSSRTLSLIAVRQRRPAERMRRRFVQRPSRTSCPSRRFTSL